MGDVTDIGIKKREPKGTDTLEHELSRAAKQDGKRKATLDGVNKVAARDKALVDHYSKTRERSAFALFTKGANYDEIADALGFENPNVVRLLIDRFLGQLVDEQRDPKRMRAKVNAQLDALIRSVMPRATDPTDPEHLAYARMGALLLERYSKVNGLDAPTVHLINPGEDEMEKYVQLWAEATGHAPAPKVDIFALTEGEDGTFQ